MNDEKIIELFQTRDEQAISETKEKYGKYCKKIALNILNDREDAEECENDAYLALWNAIPPAQPRIFSAFIAKITRNLALKKLRSKNAGKRVSSEALLSLDELSECIPDGQSFEISGEGLTDVINSFLRSLPETERKVFICRYWYCDSVSDICGQFGFGESKVKMMLLRTRKKMRAYLQERGVFI